MVSFFRSPFLTLSSVARSLGRSLPWSVHRSVPCREKRWTHGQTIHPSLYLSTWNTTQFACSYPSAVRASVQQTLFVCRSIDLALQLPPLWTTGKVLTANCLIFQPIELLSLCTEALESVFEFVLGKGKREKNSFLAKHPADQQISSHGRSRTSLYVVQCKKSHFPLQPALHGGGGGKIHIH